MCENSEHVIVMLPCGCCVSFRSCVDGTETHGIKWFVEGQKVSEKSRQHRIPFLYLGNIFLKPENQ